MTTKPTERDLIEEVEELLAKATPGPWEQSAFAIAYVISLAEGHEVICSMGEYRKDGTLELEFKNAGNNMALIIRAPALLRRMRDRLIEAEKERRIAVRFLSKHGYERCTHCDSWHEKSPKGEQRCINATAAAK